ncbi:MAG: prepilin-type N-terminal cleavage/methylation domain-containing protein [Patescibacteria group bacterium]
MSKGFTLIEVILTLGIIVIVLPATTLFLLQLLQEQTSAQAELQMEQTASLILSGLRTEMVEATSVNITNSMLGNDNGVLIFVDGDGKTVIIDRPTVGTVRRLRLQRGADPAVYISSSEIDIVAWRIDATRTDNDQTLTGLRFQLVQAMLNPDVSVYRELTFIGETTIALNPQTNEL